MAYEKPASQAAVGKRFEKILRSRGPGRDDKVVRDELLVTYKELDAEFPPPSLEHCEALERIARAYVRTKQKKEAADAAGEAVRFLRELNATNDEFYFDAITSWAEKLVGINDFATVEQLFADEIPRTKRWSNDNAHSLYQFLHAQYLYYRVKGDFEAALNSYHRVMELGIAAWGETHSQYWAIANGYVAALFEAGQFEEGIKQLEQAIEHSRKHGILDEQMLSMAEAQRDQLRSQLGG